MIKRTMQEWADFLGCYVVKQIRDYIEYEKHTIFNCPECRWLVEKPSYTTADDNVPLYWNTIDHKSKNFDWDLLPCDLDEHEWNVLVEPHTDERMIKHTMQEWADFLGCYIARTSNSGLPISIGVGCAWSESKPQMKVKGDTNWGWSFDVLHYKYNTFEHSFGKEFLPSDLNEHDWLVLVEPKEM